MNLLSIKINDEKIITRENKHVLINEKAPTNAIIPLIQNSAERSLCSIMNANCGFEHVTRDSELPSYASSLTGYRVTLARNLLYFLESGGLYSNNNSALLATAFIVSYRTYAWESPPFSEFPP